METVHFTSGNITKENIRNFTENSSSLVALNTSSSGTNIPPPLWFSYVSFAVSCILVPLGLFGNITTLVVLKKLRTFSTAARLTLMALAVSDTGSLITWTINQSFLPQLFQIDILVLTVTGCRLFVAFFRIALTCSALFVVIICIERFIVVWFPLKSKVLLTRSAVISSTVGIAIILALPAFIFTKREKGFCTPQLHFQPLLLQTFEYISITAYSIIPALVLVCLTPLTIIKLYKRLHVPEGRNKIPRHTIMLVGVVLSYVCLITVEAALFNGFALSGFNMFSNELWVVVFRTVIITRAQINYSSNFFLYNALSAHFQQEFRQLFHKRP